MNRTSASRMAAGLALLAALAAAGERPARAQRAPDFATLDRHDGISRFALDFSPTFLSGNGGAPDGALRLDLWGQYVAASGLGFYADVPVARTLGGDSDRTALGNIELGAHFVMDGPSTSLIVRGGLGLPTADDQAAPGFLAILPRLTDYALAVPSALYGRLSLSPLWHAHRLFARIDLGVDVPMSEDTAVFDADTLVRINLAGGYDAGPVAVMAELVTLGAAHGFNTGDSFVSTAALSARYMGELVEPFLAVGMPLDQAARDNADFFLGLGLQVMLH